MLQFCKSSSTGSCPAMGEYPSVGEGEISPAGCPEGFRGYAYRECQDGVLGEKDGVWEKASGNCVSVIGIVILILVVIVVLVVRRTRKAKVVKKAVKVLQ